MGGLISWKISWGRKGVRGVRRGVEIGSAADWNWQGDHPLESSPIINESLAQDDSSSNPVTEQEDRKKLPGEVYAHLRVFSTYPSDRSFGNPAM